MLCITHDIYQSFNDGLETRAVFLDISKAFEKVWHEGLHYKLKQSGISGNLLNIIKDFLSLRKQGVVLNGQHSTGVNIEVGVPQGSILGLLFFLMYVNDLTSNTKLFAHDTSLFSVVQKINPTTTDLNSGLSETSDWTSQWKMNLIPDPNKQAQEVIFSRKINKINHSPLLFNQNLVKSSSTQKHLAMVLDTKLKSNLVFNLHPKKFNLHPKTYKVREIKQ